MLNSLAGRRQLVVLASVVLAVVAAAVSPAPTSAGTVGPAYGAVLKPRAGETWPSALRRSENTYGRLGVIRYFDGNAPDAWSTLNARVTDHPAIISWRISPADVLSGSYDTLIRDWFAAAPIDRITWYAYMHEPEDNIARGEFTAADYRLAYQHVAVLARSVGNPNLRSTLVLMCYTVNPKSGRDWHDYFAGSTFVDVIGWDCYNHRSGPSGYGTPTKLLSGAIAASNSVGVPWGIAELGSTLAPGDSGSGRAAWLTAHARYAYDQGAVFVSYFDTNGAGTDYRLLDQPSQQAWHDVVSDQTP